MPPGTEDDDLQAAIAKVYGLIDDRVQKAKLKNAENRTHHAEAPEDLAARGNFGSDAIAQLHNCDFNL